ncbi:MAG TPA: alpha/beta hydrolase-fold protein [Thermoanaerobaculia bacterium]|nr:alpha/beta hydrolase-fold protein [Thermoanaerobaculia bacterium]
MIMTVMMAGAFIARSVVVDGVARKYQVWVPAAYDASRKWPAILFLHGSGERGSDGVKQTTVGLGPALGKIDPQTIVVFPQCPEDDRWVARVPRQIAIAALDATEREYSIDRKRVALTGMSMGGAGAWYLAAEYPKRWSAVAPVCGYVHRPPSIPQLGDTTTDTFDQFAKRLPHVPIWIFHGSDDKTVPVEESREMARALGPRAGYTEFAHTGHNAWDPAYQQTHVVQWLVEQRRK